MDAELLASSNKFGQNRGPETSAKLEVQERKSEGEQAVEEHRGWVKPTISQFDAFLYCMDDY
jgi:hypothetical protein